MRLPEQIELLVSFMKPKIRELAEDINGNHVMQKILFTWDPKDSQFIYDVMIEKCVQIACHKHGCCVMQKCIDAGTREQKDSLVFRIAEHTQ